MRSGRWLIAVVALTGTVAMPDAAASAGTPAWSLQTAPDPLLANGTLSSVACGLTSCMAVGDANSPSGTIRPLAAHWNGTSWTDDTAAVPSGASASSLAGVSCPSTTECVAVGTYTKAGADLTLGEQWNGKAWVVEATPSPTGEQAELAGVSCASSDVCVAVGWAVSKAGFTFTLAEVWNGKNWAIVTSQNPHELTSELASVSCKSSISCVAVGTFTNSSLATGSLAETWNGKVWTLSTAVTPAGNQAALLGVSCSSTADCVAVGSFGQLDAEGEGLTEVWNGKTWTQQTSPETGTIDLTAVSCVSASSCRAVGSSGDMALSLAEVWNGKSWSITTTPNPSDSSAIILDGVACSSATSCAAVGHDASTDGENLTLGEALTGSSWSLKVTPSPLGRTSSSLAGVSCVTATACTAVGQFAALELAESWNGKSWSIQPTAAPSGSPGDSFASVACRSTTDCMAVGTEGISLNYSGLSEEWTGKAWLIKPVPRPVGATVDLLSKVSCPVTTACVGVGFFQNSAGVNVPLAESWNGSTWKVVPVPAPAGAEESELASVACTSADSCEAVGDYDNASFATLPLAEVWNGKNWTVQATPNPKGSTDASLSDVSCSATICQAVGLQNFELPLAELWNGKTWAVESTPVLSGPKEGTLGGVTCTTAKACVAVGNYTNAKFDELTLVESWNGSAWAIVASPNPAGQGPDVLNDVACFSSSACTAVGAANGQLLVEHYAG